MVVPTLGGQAYVTDGGMETDLIFNHGFDLPEFASFPLLDDAKGWQTLTEYYRGYANIATQTGSGLILAAPTWRANPDWAAKLGFDLEQLDRINQLAITKMKDLREEFQIPNTVVVGVIGPRGDGYVVASEPTIQEAADYHRHQVDSFAAAGADLIEALTITTANEAAGIVQASNQAGVPVAILFTVETDGKQPDGTSLEHAIGEVTKAGTVAYFGINCAHPKHILSIADDGEWVRSIAEIRPNASEKSHAELDEAEELDPGDPEVLAAGVDQLRDRFPNLCIIGGCCGTDSSHVARLWGVN